MMDIDKITNVLTWYANATMQSIIYNGDDSVKVKNNENALKNMVANFKAEPWFDWLNLTDKECGMLRFVSWEGYKTACEEIKYYKSKIAELSDEAEINELKETIEREKKAVGLRLVPVWLYPFIPIGLKLTDIGGNEIINDGNLDKDQRFGALSYGIYPIDAMRFEDYEKLDKEGTE